MISYEVYKILHILGFVLVFMGLSGTLFAFASTNAVNPKLKTLGFATHGVGILLVLTAGFGLLARMGLVTGIPGWVWAKIIIWFFLAGAISLSKRKSKWTLALILVYAAAVTAAAILAILKPL